MSAALFRHYRAFAVGLLGKEVWLLVYLLSFYHWTDVQWEVGPKCASVSGRWRFFLFCCTFVLCCVSLFVRVKV